MGEFTEVASSPRSGDATRRERLANIARAVIRASDDEGAVFTDLVEAEALAELRRRHALHREAEKLARLGSWELDVDRDIVTSSEGIGEVWGLPRETRPSVDEFIAQVHEADRARFIETIARTREAGVPFEETYRIHHGRTGELRWLTSRGSVERGEDGRVVRIVGATQDVTKRIERERALQRAHERTRDAERVARVGSWEVGADLEVRTASEMFFNIIGVDPGATFAKFASVMHDEDRARAVEQIQRAIHDRVPLDAEFRIVKDDGTVVWVRALGEPRTTVPEEQATFAGALMDITKDKEAERVIQESQREIEELFDALTAFTAKLSPEGVILRTAAAAARAMGARPEDYIGVSWLDGPWWPEVDRAKVHKAFGAALRGEQVRLTAQVELPGGPRTFDSVLSPVFDETGKVAYIVAEGHDVTEQHRLQAALSAESKRLARANADLESFAYTVSHDLKAPLRGMEMYMRALEEDHQAELSKEARSIIARLRGERERMGAIIGDLLSMARGAEGEIERTSVDLSAIARTVGAILALREPSRVVDLSIHPGMRASCDAGLARILLENLIGNAWKFTSHEPSARIEVGVEHVPEGDRFFVKDDGPGFPQEKAFLLFQPFRRLRESEGFEGSGIGLATARRIVEGHGGRIWAHSVPGEGATFWFTLAPPENVRAPT